MNKKRTASAVQLAAAPRLTAKQGSTTLICNNYNTGVKTCVKSLNGKVLVPSDDGQHIIGQIKEGVFTKGNWQSSKHLCYKHNAIGIDKKAFEDYVLPHTQLIECHDRDKNITYTVSINDFKLHCIEDDLGWGAQLFCPLKYWQVQANGERVRQLAFIFAGGEGNG